MNPRWLIYRDLTGQLRENRRPMRFESS